MPATIALDLSPLGPVSIRADESLQYLAIVTYENTQTADVASAADRTSTNTSAAVIGPAGLARGVGEGTTYIAAK